MGKTKRIWRESQHPRDARGRFARRGGAAWVQRAAAELTSEAGAATSAGGRPRIARNAKAGVVLQAHTDGGRPSAVRVPKATITSRPSPANLADFNSQARAAVSAPAPKSGPKPKEFRLTRILPDGTEKTSPTTFASHREALIHAGRSLHDNGAASKADAQRFSATLGKAQLGETVRHESGYQFRVEGVTPEAPEAPKKRTPRAAPGAAALIAARAAEQAPQMPAMVAARTAPETAPVPGAENYAAMRRHTLVALARDAKINIRGKSNTEIANDLARHDEQVKADRKAKLNPSSVGTAPSGSPTARLERHGAMTAEQFRALPGNERSAIDADVNDLMSGRYGNDVRRQARQVQNRLHAQTAADQPRPEGYLAANRTNGTDATVAQALRSEPLVTPKRLAKLPKAARDSAPSHASGIRAGGVRADGTVTTPDGRVIGRLADPADRDTNGWVRVNTDTEPAMRIAGDRAGEGFSVQVWLDKSAQREVDTPRDGSQDGGMTSTTPKAPAGAVALVDQRGIRWTPSTSKVPSEAGKWFSRDTSEYRTYEELASRGPLAPEFAPPEAPTPAPRKRIPADTKRAVMAREGAAPVRDDRTPKQKYAQHANLTRAEFDTLPEADRQRVLDDLRAARDSGDTKTIPSNRTQYGTTIRGATADHVHAATNKIHELLREIPKPVDNSPAGRAARLKAGDRWAVEGATIAELDEVARAAGYGGVTQSWKRQKIVDYLRNRAAAGDRLPLRASGPEGLADALRGATPAQAMAVLEAIDADRGVTLAEMKAAAKAMGAKLPAGDKRRTMMALSNAGRDLSPAPKADAAPVAAPARARISPDAKRAAVDKANADATAAKRAAKNPPIERIPKRNLQPVEASTLSEGDTFVRLASMRDYRSPLEDTVEGRRLTVVRRDGDMVTARTSDGREISQQIPPGARVLKEAGAVTPATPTPTPTRGRIAPDAKRGALATLTPPATEAKATPSKPKKRLHPLEMTDSELRTEYADPDITPARRKAIGEQLEARGLASVTGGQRDVSGMLLPGQKRVAVSQWAFGQLAAPGFQGSKAQHSMQADQEKVDRHNAKISARFLDTYESEAKKRPFSELTEKQRENVRLALGVIRSQNGPGSALSKRADAIEAEWINNARQDATAARRAANLEKARAAATEKHVDILRHSKDPKDNSAKIKAITDGRMESADLYRTAHAGPSGQRAPVHVGRVRHTPDRREGEFQVTDRDGRLSGWVERVNHNGEQKFATYEENYDGEISLLGWADTLAHAADVLNNGEAAASTGGTLDARRISGRMFEQNPNRNKSLEQLDREALDREIAQTREYLAKPELMPTLRARAERRLANLEAERRGEPETSVDTPRVKSQNGGMTNDSAAEARRNAVIEHGTRFTGNPYSYLSKFEALTDEDFAALTDEQRDNVRFVVSKLAKRAEGEVSRSAQAMEKRFGKWGTSNTPTTEATMAGKPSKAQEPYTVGKRVEVEITDFETPGFPKKWVTGTVDEARMDDNGRMDVRVRLDEPTPTGGQFAGRQIVGTRGGNKQLRPLAGGASNTPTTKAAPVNRERTGTYTGEISTDRKTRLNDKAFTDHVITLTWAGNGETARAAGFDLNDEPVQVGDEVMVSTFNAVRRGIVTGTTRGGTNNGNTRVAYATPSGGYAQETTSPTANVLRLVDPARRPRENRAALLPKVAPEARAPRMSEADKEAAKEAKKAAEKTAAADRRQKFFDEKIKAVTEALEAPGSEGRDDPEWHLKMTTEQGLVSLAKHLGAKVPRRGKTAYGTPEMHDPAVLRKLIIDAIRARSAEGKA